METHAATMKPTSILVKRIDRVGFLCLFFSFTCTIVLGWRSILKEICVLEFEIEQQEAIAVCVQSQPVRLCFYGANKKAIDRSNG